MIQAFYTAGSGMMAQQVQVDTVAHNMANVGTTAYKEESARFRDLLYTTMVRPEEGNGNVNLQKGSGTRMGFISRSMEQGILEDTGRSLDLAIQGDGFFAVEDSVSGQVYYTRDGSFRLSPGNGGQYLVTARGDYVLDRQGRRIFLQGKAGDLQVDPAGALRYGRQDTGIRLGIVNFGNAPGLEAAGENRYRETGPSGTPSAAATGKIKQGFLEKSNVDVAAEMIRLMQAQRNYQLSSRAVQAVDEMESMTNNLRA